MDERLERAPEDGHADRLEDLFPKGKLEIIDGSDLAADAEAEAPQAESGRGWAAQKPEEWSEARAQVAEAIERVEAAASTVGYRSGDGSLPEHEVVLPGSEGEFQEDQAEWDRLSEAADLLRAAGTCLASALAKI